jgi:nicotinamidase-related amidase
MLIDPNTSSLLIVDIQARLLPKMSAADTVVANTSVLLKAAARLDVPILVSEQYRKGLGTTAAELEPLLPAGNVIEKMTFSCMLDADFAARFRALGRAQAVVAGIEAHVCVLQTAEHLLEDGVRVFVVADATSSRVPSSHEWAMQRLRAAGAVIVTTEMVVFEWLRRSGTPEFKEISALIK